MNLDGLKKPFSSTAVHWRVGSTTGDKKKGLALAYIDARDVQDRLDEVCGQKNWQSKFEVHGGRVICSIGIRIDEDWIWKSDGAGDTAVEAEKGGISDALKRAAVAWGVGRYLYSLKAPWMELKDPRKGRDGKLYASGFTDSSLASLVDLHERFIGNDVPERAKKQNTSTPQPKKDSRDTYKRLSAALHKHEILSDLHAWEEHPAVISARKSLPADWAKSLTQEITAHENRLMDKAAAA